MTTEERVTLLEQSLSTLNRVLSAQELHNRDMDHNMTILLGIASAQQLDIKAVLASQKDGDERLTHIEDRLDRLSQQVDAQFAVVNQQLSAILALLKKGDIEGEEGL
jgi:hypothetical protein